MPFQIFPGIFSSIDSYSKKVTNRHFEKHGHLPRWLTDAGIEGTPITVPHHSQFFYFDEKTNITLTGVADEIIQCPDGSYAIIDYKTAKYTNGQDALLPLYEAQLNGYAYIASRVGIAPVSSLHLVYYEPQTDLTPDGIDHVMLADGFNMGFRAKVVPVRLDAEGIVLPLLRKVRETADQDEPMEGRRGCGDCERVERMLDHLPACP